VGAARGAGEGVVVGDELERSCWAGVRRAGVGAGNGARRGLWEERLGAGRTHLGPGADACCCFRCFRCACCARVTCCACLPAAAAAQCVGPQGADLPGRLRPCAPALALLLPCPPT
jgi:hypothetical protein